MLTVADRVRGKISKILLTSYVNAPISIKCMYEIAVLAKIFLKVKVKYVIYTVLLIFQKRHPKFRTVYTL